MAQEVMKELKYDGSKVVVEVARRDAKGNTIDTTYATLTAVNAKLDTSAFNTYIGTTAPSTYVAIKDFKTNYLDKNSVAYQSDISDLQTSIDNLETSVDSVSAKADKNAEDILSLREYTSDELSNRYTKSQTYSKDEVNSIVQQLEVGEWQVVTSLPTTGEEGVVYLVGTAQPYDMYIWENSAWLKIGTTQIDLSGYVPTSRTVNGHALTSNVTVTKSDVGLGSVANSGQSIVYKSKLADASIYFTQNGAYNLYSDLSNIDGQLLDKINDAIDDIEKVSVNTYNNYVHIITSQSDMITATRNTSDGVSYILSSKLVATDVSIG